MKLVMCDNKRLARLIRRGKRFVCFGAGQKLQNLCDKLDLAGHVDWIADNNPDLWGKTVDLTGCAVEVRPPDQAVLEGQAVVITTIYYQQVYEQIAQMQNWMGAGKVYFLPSKADRNYLRFAWLWKRLKPQKKMAFHTGLEKYVPGFDFSDNSRALYEYMLQMGYQKNYKMIWYVQAPSAYPELHRQKNVTVLSSRWKSSQNLLEYFRHAYHLYTSKYIFFTDTDGWLKHCNPGQIRVNLWHGCGFKGRKTPQPTDGTAYEFMTVTSPLYADIHAKIFCRRDQILITGLAKEDWLFQPPENELSDILHIAPAKKYIFWLPTFRMAVDGYERLNEYELDSETGLPLLKTMEEARRLNQLLEENNLSLVIKLHPIQQSALITHFALPRIRIVDSEELVAKGIQINTLLSKVDALISDYSSVAIDYLLLNRPMAFAVEDADQYGESRGFVFENIHDYLPGEELYTYEDLERFVLEIAHGEDPEREKRQRLRNIMHTYHDGNNCKRILETLGIENK